MKKFLRGILPEWLQSRLRRRLNAWQWQRGRASFAQEGEDLILFRHFEHRMDKPGFYVDIGAHHPHRFSNTFFFYRHGWRGINIEPNPDMALHFRRARPFDITLSCGCGPLAGSLPYYMFDDPALNTFDAEQAQRVEALGKNRVERKIDVPIRTLASILDEHLPAGYAIDFMTVDVEGFDLEVLRSNDWQRFRPEFLLVEILNTPLNATADYDVAAYLKKKDYDLVGKAVHTAFFRRRDGDPITSSSRPSP